jgi:hypothetical protein
VAWILGVLVILLFVGLTRCFIISARAIHRDINLRFDAIRARLESDANALVGEALASNRPPNDAREP